MARGLAAALLLLAACESGLTEDNIFVAQQAANTAAVFGTVGIDSAGRAAQIQGAPQGVGLCGWNPDLPNWIPSGKVGDFDRDGFDEFVVRSDWGIGIIGNTATDALCAKALTGFPTDIGLGWKLSPDDQVVAVGTFGTRTMMVLKGVAGTSNNGFAFVGISNGALQAVQVHRYVDSLIKDPSGAGHWRIMAGDEIIGTGRLTGRTDDLVFKSAGFLGILEPDQNGNMVLITIHNDGAVDANGNGSGSYWCTDGNTGTCAGSQHVWRLQTTDPRFRFLGESDFDTTADKKNEMVLASSEGLIILRVTGNGFLDRPALKPLFIARDGEMINGTGVRGTMHFLAKVTDIDGVGGADLLYQDEVGIRLLSLVDKAAAVWSFKVAASANYGGIIPGGWVLDGADQIWPLVGDFAGTGAKSVVISSNWGIGFLGVSGTGFQTLALSPYSSLPFSEPERLVAVGKLDRLGPGPKRRVVFDNRPDPVVPPRPAVLTYHNEPGRAGLNDRETSLTVSRVRAGMARKPGSPVPLPDSGEVSAQVLYAPAVSLVGDPTPRDLIYVYSNSNILHVIDVGSATVAYKTNIVLAQEVFDVRASTPVIDYDKKILYLTFQKPDRTFWLAAVDMTTNALHSRLRPIPISGSYPTASFKRNEFNPANHRQRPGLLLSRGSLYVAFGAAAGEETIKYHGWIFRYDAETFKLLGIYNTSPNELEGVGGWANGAGIWSAGGGVVGDEKGQVYVLTGNGPVNGTKYTYGDSLLKLAPRGHTLQLRRFYTPGNAHKDGYQIDLWKKDWDLGGGSPFIVPGSNLVIGSGKEGVYHVVDKETVARKQDLQAAFNLFDNVPTLAWAQGCRLGNHWLGSPHMHGSAVSWNSWIYHQGEMDYLRAYKLANGAIDANQTLVANDGRMSPENDNLASFMRSQLSVSSNGTDPASAIVWATLQARDEMGSMGSTAGCVVGNRAIQNKLTAYEASTLRCLWSTDIESVPMSTPPTIAGGMVIVPSSNGKVHVFVRGTQLTGGCPSSPLPAPNCGARACAPCGGASQGCCVNGTCNLGLFCNSARTCQSCGGGPCCGVLGKPCCGTACTESLVCNVGECRQP